MKGKILFFGLSILFSVSLYGQNNIDSLISQGIKYHDTGKYRKAIEVYKQALEINPDSPIVLYELSISLIETNHYVSAINYSNRLIEMDDTDYSPLAYNIKASCLNYLKRTDEAIQVFIEGINKYDNIALLHFNLALAYFVKKDFLKAKDAFVESIYLDPKYAGSHLNLARTMVNLNQWPEALLCFYYFLLLENDTKRAVIAYESIVEQLKIDSSEMDVFISKTKDFFEMMKTQKEEKIMTEYWADFYIPFFETAEEKGYLEDLCNYISLYFNKNANNWGKRNEARLSAFGLWMENWQ